LGYEFWANPCFSIVCYGGLQSSGIDLGLFTLSRRRESQRRPAFVKDDKQGLQEHIAIDLCDDVHIRKNQIHISTFSCVGSDAERKKFHKIHNTSGADRSWPLYFKQAPRIPKKARVCQRRQTRPSRDVFLKALFVVFDKRGPSLGFAAPA
jgi:hypothetical protein